MDVPLNRNKLEKLILNYSNQNTEENKNIAPMFAILKIMKDYSPNEQIEILGDHAFDFYNHKQKFYSELSDYEKYIGLIPMQNPPEDKKEFLEGLKKDSNLARKLISLRLLEEMNMFQEIKKPEKKVEDIYSLAFSEYIKKTSSPSDAMRIAISDVLREKGNVAYKILGDAYIESISIRKKIEKKDYSGIMGAAEYLIPDFSKMSQKEKITEIENIINFDLFDGYLTLIAEKLRKDFFDMKILNDKITKYYEE